MRHTVHLFERWSIRILTAVHRGLTQSVRTNAGELSIPGHEKFIRKFFQTINHESCYHSTLYNPRHERVVFTKQTATEPNAKSWFIHISINAVIYRQLLRHLCYVCSLHKAIRRSCSFTADYEAVRAYGAISQTTAIWIHILHCYSVVNQVQILRVMECDAP